MRSRHPGQPGTPERTVQETVGIPSQPPRGRWPESAVGRYGLWVAAKRGNPGAINARGRAAVTDGTPRGRGPRKGVGGWEKI